MPCALSERVSEDAICVELKLYVCDCGPQESVEGGEMEKTEKKVNKG